MKKVVEVKEESVTPTLRKEAFVFVEMLVDEWGVYHTQVWSFQSQKELCTAIFLVLQSTPHEKAPVYRYLDDKYDEEFVINDQKDVETAIYLLQEDEFVHFHSGTDDSRAIDIQVTKNKLIEKL